MKFAAAAAIALLATLGLAAPTSPVPASENPLVKRVNDCGGSTFENQSSGGSPTVADCRRLHDNIAGDGTWISNPNTQRTLATYGTCAFGVDNTGLGIARIGNEDIRDLIRDSINRFQWNNLVGAKGRMTCQGPTGDQTVTWGLYHT